MAALWGDIGVLGCLSMEMLDVKIAWSRKTSEREVESPKNFQSAIQFHGVLDISSWYNYGRIWSFLQEKEVHST